MLGFSGPLHITIELQEGSSIRFQTGRFHVVYCSICFLVSDCCWRTPLLLSPCCGTSTIIIIKGITKISNTGRRDKIKLKIKPHRYLSPFPFLYRHPKTHFDLQSFTSDTASRCISLLHRMRVEHFTVRESNTQNQTVLFVPHLHLCKGN